MVNVGKYTIHGFYGIPAILFLQRSWFSSKIDNEARVSHLPEPCFSYSMMMGRKAPNDKQKMNWKNHVVAMTPRCLHVSTLRSFLNNEYKFPTKRPGNASRNKFSEDLEKTFSRWKSLLWEKDAVSQDSFWEAIENKTRWGSLHKLMVYKGWRITQLYRD